MAATTFTLSFILLLSNLLRDRPPTTTNGSFRNFKSSNPEYLIATQINSKLTIELAIPCSVQHVVKVTCCHRFHQVRTPQSKWNKHDYLYLSIPGHNPDLDITIYMDISVNPCPTIGKRLNLKSRTEIIESAQLKKRPHLHISFSRITYSRCQLMDIRHSHKHQTSPTILHSLKINNILRYRGTRGGQQQQECGRRKHRITVRISYRSHLFSASRLMHPYVNTNNLIAIPTFLRIPSKKQYQIPVVLSTN